MDRSELERSAVKEVIGRYAKLVPSIGVIRHDLAFDDQSGVYCLLSSGWDPEHRVCDVLIYVTVDVAGIHIEHDGIEHGITSELIELGVCRDRIDYPFLKMPPEVSRRRSHPVTVP